MSAPDWWERLGVWKQRLGVVLFFGGLIGAGVVGWQQLQRAIDLPAPFEALEDTTHRHFSWAEGHEVSHSEEHEEFLEAADSIVHTLRDMQTRQMQMDALQRWQICDERMEDDIAAGRPPRDCPPEITVPGGGG